MVTLYMTIKIQKKYSKSKTDILQFPYNIIDKNQRLSFKRTKKKILYFTQDQYFCRDFYFVNQPNSKNLKGLKKLGKNTKKN